MSAKVWTGRLGILPRASFSDTNRIIRLVEGENELKPVFGTCGDDATALVTCRSRRFDKFLMASSVCPGVPDWLSAWMRPLALTARYYFMCRACAHLSACLE